MTNFTVHFQINQDYNGEFGFDWIDPFKAKYSPEPILFVQNSPLNKLEYVYDDIQDKYLEVNGNKDLQYQMLKEYKTLKINDKDDYYIPYLNMFEEQEIELTMIFDILNDTTDITKEFITFEKNDAYLVTIDGQTNENIRYTPNGKPKDITIKCRKSSEETYIIAKDKDHNTIGKICAKDNQTSYNLNLRIVLVVEDTPQKDAEIDLLIEKFKESKIEEYLNQKSLNQALIKTKVEIDKKYYVALNKDDIDSIFSIPEGGNTKSMFNKLADECRSRIETDEEKFNGVLIFLNHIDMHHINTGRAVTRNTPGTEIIIFKNDLGSGSTYAHEIGHALGLKHLFIGEPDLRVLITKDEKIERLNHEIIQIDDFIKQNVKIAQQQKIVMAHIGYQLANIRRFAIENDPEKIAIVQNFEQQFEERKRTNEQGMANIYLAIRKQTKNKKALLNLQTVLPVLKQNKYKFQQGTTSNIMDYVDNKCTFTHWQWEIMQNNIKNITANLS